MEIDDYKETFQREFKDLDNISFLVPSNRFTEEKSFINFNVHLFYDFLIESKFLKLFKFYINTKKSLFPNDLVFQLFNTQSLIAKEHSLSRIELNLIHYQDKNLLKNSNSLDLITLRRPKLANQTFLNQLYATANLYNLITTLKKENLTLAKYALLRPHQFIYTLAIGLFVTKSHKSKISTTKALINDACELVTNLKEEMIKFLSDSNIENFNSLMETYNKSYVFEHFSEFCKDNLIDKKELDLYSNICATDREHLLLPYFVEPKDGDFAAFIPDIAKQTQDIYFKRLNAIHERLNFNKS
tara:strand:+ start:25293 stop:26192 length:900 start_codon:yes stop_codon:yes gene_type:complete